KVSQAWETAGATVGWRTRYQHFDYRPDFKYYPELLPSLWLRTFKPGVITRLPAPDVPFHFYLHGSAITDAGVRELAALAQLGHLELSANYTLTGAGFAELAGLPDLRVLRLYQTRVNDAGLKEICRIKTLRELDIGNTAVTEAGLTGLADLKRLQVLG